MINWDDNKINKLKEVKIDLENYCGLLKIQAESKPDQNLLSKIERCKKNISRTNFLIADYNRSNGSKKLALTSLSINFAYWRTAAEFIQIPEILIQIALLLDPFSFLKLSNVSKQMFLLIKQNPFLKVFKNIGKWGCHKITFLSDPEKSMYKQFNKLFSCDLKPLNLLDPHEKEILVEQILCISNQKHHKYQYVKTLIKIRLFAFAKGIVSHIDMTGLQLEAANNRIDLSISDIINIIKNEGDSAIKIFKDIRIRLVKELKDDRILKLIESGGF